MKMAVLCIFLALLFGAEAFHFQYRTHGGQTETEKGPLIYITEDARVVSVPRDHLGLATALRVHELGLRVDLAAANGKVSIKPELRTNAEEPEFPRTSGGARSRKMEKRSMPRVFGGGVIMARQCQLSVETTVTRFWQKKRTEYRFTCSDGRTVTLLKDLKTEKDEWPDTYLIPVELDGSTKGTTKEFICSYNPPRCRFVNLLILRFPNTSDKRKVCYIGKNQQWPSASYNVKDCIDEGEHTEVLSGISLPADGYGETGTQFEDGDVIRLIPLAPFRLASDGAEATFVPNGKDETFDAALRFANQLKVISKFPSVNLFTKTAEEIKGDAFMEEWHVQLRTQRSDSQIAPMPTLGASPRQRRCQRVK